MFPPENARVERAALFLHKGGQDHEVVEVRSGEASLEENEDRACRYFTFSLGATGL